MDSVVLECGHLYIDSIGFFRLGKQETALKFLLGEIGKACDSVFGISACLLLGRVALVDYLQILDENVEACLFLLLRLVFPSKVAFERVEMSLEHSSVIAVKQYSRISGRE